MSKKSNVLTLKCIFAEMEKGKSLTNPDEFKAWWESLSYDMAYAIYVHIQLGKALKRFSNLMKIAFPDNI